MIDAPSAASPCSFSCAISSSLDSLTSTCRHDGSLQYPTSPVPVLPLLPLFRLFSFLPLENVIQLGRLNREFFRVITELWCPDTLIWTYELRQKLRRQIFVNPHDISLPSHFTHIFNDNPRHDILRLLLFGAREPGSRTRLKNLIHYRSSKRLKLHHPYFYRQLPLAITPDSVLSGPVLNPEDIPLPHDLSLIDIFHLLLANYRSLENVDIHTFDTSPLPWNSTPSRVCPRDILPQCCYQTTSAAPTQSVCVWCPDCKPAQHEHSACWRAAGKLVINRFLKQAADDEDCARALQRGLNGGIGPVFRRLKSLRFKGWGVTNFMAVLRIFGCAVFPELETLELSGTVIMAPALTDTKDAEPRPQMSLESLSLNQCPLDPAEQEEKLMQVLSFHISPFARYANLVSVSRPPAMRGGGGHTPVSRGGQISPPRRINTAMTLDNQSLSHTPATRPAQGTEGPSRTTTTFDNSNDNNNDYRRYKEQAVKEYWMGHFNGQLWRAEGFPRLRSLSLRVGNFDDACRWITPMMANCFALCPELRTLELDHTVLHPMRPDNPILKLFSLCTQDSAYFPKLRFLLLRSVESPLQLADIQRQVSNFVRRPVIVKTRKLFLRVASEHAADEAALVRHWAELQRQRLHVWIHKNAHSLSEAELKELTSFSDEELSIFNSTTDGSAMLMLNFDSTQDAARFRAAAAAAAEAGGEGGEGEAAQQLLMQAQQATDEADVITSNTNISNLLCYGSQVAKIQLKQFTPTNPEHSELLRRIRLCDLQNEQMADYRQLFEACAPELAIYASNTSAYPESMSGYQGTTFSMRRASSLTLVSTNAGDDCFDETTFPPPSEPQVVPRQKPLRRVTIQFDLPQIWQHTPEQAKIAVTKEVSTLRELLKEHPDMRNVEEARVMSCTRLTYGGSNWPWWEELICGKVHRRLRQVGSGGWVRESSEILNEEELRVFRCDHVAPRTSQV